MLMSTRLARGLVLSTLTACVAVIACGGDDGGDASNAGTGGSGGTAGTGGGAGDAAPPQDAQFDSPMQTGGSGGGGLPDADPDATCGATGITIEALPPDLVVVFDRSCSMRRFYNSNEPVFGYGPTDPATRWAVASKALDTIMSQYDNRIRFGLMVFPRPYQGCGDSPNVNVLPQISNRVTMLDTLAQLHPFDVCQTDQQPKETPTGEALQAVLGAGIFEPATRDAYVLLMTDGMATCGATPDSLGQLVTSIRNAGAKTAVVGFGDFDQAVALEMLNTMGQAGGVKTSAPWYWFAEDPGALDAAIGEVVKNAVSCTFQLNDTPPDPDKIYAYFDGTAVDADPGNGWTYDAATDTVTFHGTSCESLQSGSVKNVSVVFGCPDSTCVPSPEVCDGYDNDCDDEVDEGVCVG